MSDIYIKISDNGNVAVEENVGGIKRYKNIKPDDLISCIGSSLRQHIASGLLPDGCLSYTQNHSGDKGVCLRYPNDRGDILYYDTLYPDFPLPKLVFGFRINADGRVFDCSLGVTENTGFLKPETKMYLYPFSNVQMFRLCTGNNPLPKCKSLHTLASLPHLIMAMPNNNDYFRNYNNRLGLEMRDLLEHLMDKEPDYYYSDILIPFVRETTLKDFIEQASGVSQ